MESEVFIQSLGLNTISFVKINNLPLLVLSFVFVPDNNLSSFLIFSSMDIKSFLVSDIDEVTTFISKDLEPFRVGAVDLHVGSCS